MKLLLIGGTGVISTEVSKLSVGKGYEVVLLNRGTRTRGLPPEEAREIHADIRNKEQVKNAIGNEKFDVIVDFLSFSPAQLHNTLEIFRGRYQQYIFISSAVVYQRGLTNVTEDSPLLNLAWDYSRNKIGCEQLLGIEDHLYGCDYTIVRPNVTYGDTRIPAALISNHQWSFADRILRGKPIVMQDDGSALTELTHSSDFAKGLCGLYMNPLASRQAYHIVSDERLTWKQIAVKVGEALGAETKFAYISSDDIVRTMPMTQQGETFGVLHCHKSVSTPLNNTKIKTHVPEFVCTTNFDAGIRRTVQFYQTHPEFMLVDDEWNQEMDHLINLYCH
jgi:nucleoside-diphosphate-sugar epimerase